MNYLIYVSRSVDPFPTDLRSILESSHKNNAKLGISGALCFLDGVYCQYIEGEGVVLEDLYKRVAKDPRHKDAKLVDYRSISKRRFTKWEMALVTWNEQTRLLFKALNPIDTFDLYAITSDTAAATFDALANSANWLEIPVVTQNLDVVATQNYFKPA